VCTAVGNLPLWTGIATATTFAGLVAAGPSLVGGMARLADHGRRGGSWRLASRNVARSARRAAATALALTIGLTVVSAVAVTASSMKASVAEAVSSGNRSDLFLQGASSSLGISPAAADLLRARNDVEAVVELRHSSVRIAGQNSLVSGIDTTGLDRVLDLGIKTGSLGALETGGILVGDKQARELEVSVGDSVRMTFPETGDTTMTVAGTFSQQNIIGTAYVISIDDFAAHVTSRLDVAILVTVPPDVDPDRVKTDIKAALADYPNITVSNPEDLTRRVQASVNQMLGLVTALLLLAVIVAVLGIVNTLVLAVVERTRELGLMRAVGATRRQVRTVIRRESVLMSLLGAVTGIALGTASGVALSRSLADQGISALSVPVTTLASYVLVAAVVGVLAAVGPARRAGRVDVLQAITTE
jgi:putative ABC transport system permease protein